MMTLLFTGVVFCGPFDQWRMDGWMDGWMEGLARLSQQLVLNRAGS